MDRSRCATRGELPTQRPRASSRASHLVGRVAPAFFFSTFCSATAFLSCAATDAYFFRKRSTRPAVSTSLYFPVKKGWQLAQISTWKDPRVERVSITFPHAQVMREGG